LSRPAAPGLAFTYEGHHPALLERVLPLVEYVEITPDTIAEVRQGAQRLNPETLAELQGIGGAAQVIAHGVGLSIGSHDGPSEAYLRLLDELLERVEMAWHSEHLGYTTVDGQHLGTMLPVPRTEEALDLVCGRVTAIQERYGLPFLLENVVGVLPDYGGDYSEAGFLNALCGRTGCGLILDVYNLECDARNQGLDLEAFLAELDLSHVRELHLACGSEHRGVLMDVHSRLPRESTVELARRCLADAPGVRAVTFELLTEFVPVLGYDAIVNGLAGLRQRLLC
jgi:uncharacterized protein (UPF0276 family)